MKIKFHHIVCVFIMGLSLYIGILIAQLNNNDVKDEVSSKAEAPIKKNHKQLSIPTINSASRMDDVFGYFQYISREMDYLKRVQGSMKEQPGEGDIERLREIIFQISLKIKAMKDKKVPDGYDNIHLNFQKNVYSKEKYYQSYYDYIISKDSKHIEEINNSILKGEETWKLVLDELEIELKKDGFNTNRRENGISASYEKTRYGF